MRRRLVADVPLGALLSGGIDSSIVVAAMAQASSEPVRTFTVGFADARYDERALRARRRGALRHRPRGARDRARAGAASSGSRSAFDEPFGDEAALPTLLVCEATRQHVKVALVGDGGDEVFGGYERYRGARARRAHPGPRGVARRAACSARCRRRGASRARRSSARAASSTSRRRRRPSATRSLVEVFPLELRRRLWTDEALAHATTRATCREADDLRLVDIESYLPGDLLPKADLASMAVSLELRSPFLDHRVVELGLSLPPELAAGQDRAQAGVRRRPAARDRGPRQGRASASRSTAGSARSCGRSPTTCCSAARTAASSGAPSSSGCSTSTPTRRADHGHRLWCLCMLELWQRTHVDAGRPALAACVTPPSRLRARRGGLRAAAARACCCYERGDIVASFTEKSWHFARTFVDSGTFGFIARHAVGEHPAALRLLPDPDLWIFDQSWLAVGLAQIAVAVATALLVYEIGRRVTTRRASAVLAAVIATLQPYLVWHDVHVNREILDQLLGAAMVLLALVAVTRRTLWPAVALGAVAGLAILSNTRLAAAAARCSRRTCSGARPASSAALAMLAAAALVARAVGRAQPGPGRLLRDHDRLARALEGEQPRRPTTCSRAASWIDDVPTLPGAPPLARAGRRPAGGAAQNVPDADECAQMRALPGRGLAFWRDHPGEKAKLMGQATVLLWQPSVFETRGRPDSGGRDRARCARSREPAVRDPALPARDRRPARSCRGAFLVLALGFVGYETFAAWVFAGTTRYRVPWDFLLALLAAAALARLPFRSLRRGSRCAAVEPEAVDLLGPLGAAVLGEALDRARARRRGPSRRRALGVVREPQHRLGERLGVAGRRRAGPSRRRGRGPRARRSTRRSPAARAPSPRARPCRTPRRATARRRASDSSIAAWTGVTWPRKRTASVEPELAREVLQPVLEHAAAGDVEPQRRAARRARAGTRAAARRGP